MKSHLTWMTFMASFFLLQAMAQNPPEKAWDHRYGGINSEILHGMLPTADGGYLQGGYSASAVSGDQTQEPRSASDYRIIKTDANGAVQWDADFGGDEDEGIASLIQTADGGYLLGGDSWSGINGDKTQLSQAMSDYFIVKINDSGVKQWDARFGGEDTEYFFLPIETSEGGFLLCGVSTSGTGRRQITGVPGRPRLLDREDK